MAAPTVRGVSATTGSGTTSAVAALPASTAAGDLLVILVESSDSTTAAGTPNTPTDWYKSYESTYGSGATGVTTLTIFTKLHDGSESDVTIDGVGNHTTTRMAAITTGTHGVYNVQTDLVIGTVTQTQGTTGLTITGINVTADSLILMCFGFTDDANDTSNINAYTNGNLTGITKQFDESFLTGAGGGVALVTGACAGTSTGDSTITHDNAVHLQMLHIGVPPKVVRVTKVDSNDIWPTPEHDPAGELTAPAGTTTLTARAYRWYADGAEASSSALVAENTSYAVSAADDATTFFQLRYGIQESGGAAGATTDDYQLQYQIDAGGWNNVTGATTGIKAYPTGALTDAAATTNRLSAGTGSFVAGELDEADGLIIDYQITASNYTELLYSLQAIGSDLAEGVSITFRVLRNGSVLDTYSQTPTLTTPTAPTLTARAYRWYADGTEAGATALAAENASYQVSDTSDANVVLRYGIQATTAVAGPSSDDYRLQYKLNAGSFTDVTSSSSVVKGFASGNLTDTGATTSRLSAGSGSFVAGEISEIGLVSDYSITASNYTDLVYALTTVAADIAPSDSITFRVLRNGAVLNTYSQTPTLTASASQTLTNSLIGTNGTTLTSGSGGNTTTGGNFLSGISGTGAGDQIAFSTAKFHSGTSSALLVSTATGNEYMEWTTPEWAAATQTSYFRTYINIASSAATNDNKFIRVRDSGGTLIAALDVTTDRRIAIEDSVTQTTSTIPIPFNQWIRAEIQVPIGNSVSIVAKLFFGKNLEGEVPNFTVTLAGADTDVGNSNIGTVQFGNSIAGPIAYFDDIGASTNTWLGPVTGSNQHEGVDPNREYPTPDWDPANELSIPPVTTLTARAYRWYADGTESGASALASENAAYEVSAAVDGNLVLRYGLQESGGLDGNATDDYQLQYSLNDGGSWSDVTSGSSYVKGFTSANLTDGAATTSRLSAGTGSFVAGEISETDGLLTDYQITANNYTDLLFAITTVAADIAPGDTITFQVLRNGAVLDTYTILPTLTTASTGANNLHNYFEGTNDAALTQGSGGNTGGASGDYFDIVSTSGAAPDGVTFDTSVFHSGTSSVEVNSTNSGPEYVAWVGQWTDTTNTVYVRAYIYIKTRGNSSPTQIIRIYDSDVGTPIAFLRLDGSSSGNPAVRSGDQGSGTGTPSSDLSLNTWYRIEMEVPIGNSVTITTRIFSGANLDGASPSETVTQTTADTLRTAGNVAEVRFASSVNSTVLNFDDVGISDTDWLGPYIAEATQVTLIF